MVKVTASVTHNQKFKCPRNALLFIIACAKDNNGNSPYDGRTYVQHSSGIGNTVRLS